MKVIMVHDVGGVGRRNEVKNVADGYALNFLIPNGHALQATTERLKAHETRLATDKRTVDDREKKFIQGLERLRGANVRILARANPTGGLYQELNGALIAAAVQREYGIHIPPESVIISTPIKKVGNSTVTISLGGHTADIRVSVTKNG